MAKLLVVEKSAALRDFLRLHLETAGHSVLTAEDAAAARRIARTGTPQLVVAGQGAEGLPLLKRLRALAPVPLILISVRGDADAIAQARAAGATDCLVLPVTREALLRSVAAHLGGAGAAAAPPTSTDLRGVRHGIGVPGGGEVDPAGEERHAPPPFDPAMTAIDGLSARDGHAASAIASQEARSGTVLFADIRNFSPRRSPRRRSRT